MAGGATSPPIFRAAWRIEVPGSTSMVILSIVTLNNFFSSAIIIFYLVLRGGYLQWVSIMRKAKVSMLRFHRIRHMPFKLIPEMPDRRRNRPGSRIPQRTNGIPFYLTLDVPQQVDI